MVVNERRWRREGVMRLIVSMSAHGGLDLSGGRCSNWIVEKGLGHAWMKGMGWEGFSRVGFF